MTAEDAAWIPVGIPSDRAASDEHHISLGMIGAQVGILDCGPAKFRQRDYNQVVPRGLISVVHEVFSQGIHRPANPSQKIRLVARERALIAVGIKSAHLGS